MSSPEIGSKVKHVRRTISLLEYFAQEKKSVTVMDVVRRFGIPQSSVCELLAVLVDIGILSRSCETKAFSATPRLAALGLATQPPAIAGGGLFHAIEQFSSDWKVAVGLFGMLGTDVQVQSLSNSDALLPELALGSRLPLSRSSVGMVLLSALRSEQYDRMLWRLLSEAPEGARFDYTLACRRVRSIAAIGWGAGDCGFAPGWSATAVLLPEEYGSSPLVVAALYPNSKRINAQLLAGGLRNTMLNEPSKKSEAEKDNIDRKLQAG